MNRETKFRALGLDGKMYDNAIEIGVDKDDAAYLVARLPKDCGIRRFLQWTGLKDKNGKEIYDSDLLKTDKNIACRVYWSSSGACFMIKYHNKWSTKIGWYIYKTLRVFAPKSEVIGNIYSNKESLEKQ